MHVRRATTPFFKLFAEREEFYGLERSPGIRANVAPGIRLAVFEARVLEIFVPLSSIPCPKRDSLSRDARVLPLFSTPFVATNLEDINVDFVFVTRVTAMARGEGVQVACIKFEHRSGSREKGHDAITLG